MKIFLFHFLGLVAIVYFVTFVRGVFFRKFTKLNERLFQLSAAILFGTTVGAILAMIYTAFRG